MARHQLHGDIQHTLVLAEFIDGHKVRVVQRAGGLGLPGEALFGFITLCGTWKDGLDSHFAADGRILAKINFPHGPLAQYLFNVKLAKFFKHGSFPLKAYCHDADQA